jgi:starch synthase
MQILFIASEVYPLVKVGGLADVTASLAAALRELGHEPYFILPRYRLIDTPLRDAAKKSIVVSYAGSNERVALKQTTLKGAIPVYLVENDAYFGTGEVYPPDELQRFSFFSQCVPHVISELSFRPDVVHCHDWHTALVPLWLKRAGMDLPSVFTIHNLAYQGRFDEEFLSHSGLAPVWREYVPSGAPQPGLNFMSQGILLADILTTVSPTYASEILTPQYGEGLQSLLAYRQKELCGITNGIDYGVYNPQTDPYLERNYDSGSLENRMENKLVVQRKTGLPQDPDVPLFGMVSRLEEQKGINLLLQAIDGFVRETGAQLVVLGRGREHYHRLLMEAALRYPGRVTVSTGYDERLGRLIYGGCDMFLMPSRFEPCGLGQMIAMRYGAIPVVRHTGGLADTVKDVTRAAGNGFVFRDYSVPDMTAAIRRALEGVRQYAEWRTLMKRNMALDFSWKASGRKYEEVYLRAQKAARTCSS